jgi:CubicO group peptidase (beta-lactamase class C family)
VAGLGRLGTDADALVRGSCADELAAVRAAFAENFASRGELGGALCVIVDGRVAVDLVGGFADVARTRPWTPDTLVNVYSAGKAALATLGLQLVEEGRLDLDARVADLWPEFAAGGKARATVRHAFAHLAGVPAIREPLTNQDLWSWERMVEALAATEAWFEPGSRVVYHTNTYGHLLGEIVRRAGGRTPAEALRRLGAATGSDVACALSPDEQARCAEVVFEAPPGMRDALAASASSADDAQRMIALAYMNPPGYGSGGVVNTPQWRGAQLLAANAHASARGLARLYAALLEPDLVLSSGLLEQAIRVQAEGPCPVLGERIAFGLGFTPTSARRKLGSSERAFGFFGTGGSVGFADPETRVAFGYVTSRVAPGWQTKRNRALLDALDAACGRTVPRPAAQGS